MRGVASEPPASLAPQAALDYARQAGLLKGRRATTHWASFHLLPLFGAIPVNERVVVDGVMAQVEMQCGPFTVVSLMSADAVRELNLEPGSIAVAVVKATTVIVETSGGQS